MRFFRFLAACLILILAVGVMQAQDTPEPVLLFYSYGYFADGDGYGGDVYAYDLQNATLHRITPANHAGEHDPMLAPDGRYLVLTVGSGTSSQLEVLPLAADGTVPDLWMNILRLEWNNSVTIWGAAEWSPVIHADKATLAYITNSD